LGRIALAFRAFFAILGSGKISAELASELGLVPRMVPKPAVKPEAATQTADGAIQILGILQRDARLVDFLMEDISAYGDDQVGAAVRTLHEQSRKSLSQYVKLSPVIDGVEGAYTKMENAEGVKLIGNVPPDGKAAGGVLRHRGWKVESIALPTLTAKAKLTVLAPAEIEVE
jgi:enoyl-CoA hydratase/carnithine racemase